MPRSGRLLQALVVVTAAMTVVSADDDSVAVSGLRPEFPGDDPTPRFLDICEQCCARSGRPCPFCPPCRRDAFNPCSVVICPGLESCVVYDGKAVCLGADEPAPGLAQCPEVSFASAVCPLWPRDQCSSDADCGGDGRRRCCSDGCRRRCTPTCWPPCTGGRQCQLVNHYWPSDCLFNCPPPVEMAKCELPADANPCAVTLCQVGTSCEVQNGVGVCVPLDDNGRVCPFYLRTALCLIPDNECDSDSDCGPLDKCCQRNCGRQCVPSCSACGPGEVCVTAPENFNTRVAIGFPPPPPLRATCVSANPTIEPPTFDPVREGQCPRETQIATCEVKLDNCFSDSQCPEGQRCCSGGCGRACTPVCQDCDGPLHQCVLQQVQCIRAPCPPLALCQRLPFYLSSDDPSQIDGPPIY